MAGGQENCLVGPAGPVGVLARLVGPVMVSAAQVKCTPTERPVGRVMASGQGNCSVALWLGSRALLWFPLGLEGVQACTAHLLGLRALGMASWALLGPWSGLRALRGA